MNEAQDSHTWSCWCSSYAHQLTSMQQVLHTSAGVSWTQGYSGFTHSSDLTTQRLVQFSPSHSAVCGTVNLRGTSWAVFLLCSAVRSSLLLLITTPSPLKKSLRPAKVSAAKNRDVEWNEKGKSEQTEKLLHKLSWYTDQQSCFSFNLTYCI